MELSAFAQHLLFSPSLEAKLHRPALLTDAQRQAPCAVPLAPAREGALCFQRGSTKKRVPFPTLLDLAKPEQRALVLHFFANHELLALELMALALLRFPDAPSKFRRGLAATMMEEQEHLRLYQGRMLELGMSFGDVAVNSFFWDTIATATSPLTFVTQMALTLEQANLDFSLHYLRLFRTLGDDATAAILQTVYDDEITHVRHGVLWFNAWRGPGESDWQAYRRLLPPPLTPARAKGSAYHEEPRHAAGLSAEFIQELSVYQHSKGRPPQLFWFNPDFEAEVANASAHYVAPAAVATVGRDLGSLLGFIAGAEDVVLVTERPSTEFLHRLQSYGFSLPQYITSPSELDGRLVDRFVPWGQSPAAAAVQERMQLTLQQPYQAPKNTEIFSKAWAKALALELWPDDTVGRVCATFAEVVQVATQFAKTRPVVMKAPLGSAGRAMQRLRRGESLTPQQQRWVTNVLAAQGCLVVEPWLEKVFDLSVQINVGSERTIVGQSRFLTDARGQYIGHVVGRFMDGLPAACVRAYHEQGMPAQLQRTAQAVAAKLAAAGYVGAAGIDAFVYTDADKFRLCPLVEINCRHTMGKIALALDRHVHASAVGRWLHLPLRQVQAWGWADFSSFAAGVTERFPVVLRRDLIVSGIFATNDPSQAEATLTILKVGETSPEWALRT